MSRIKQRPRKRQRALSPDPTGGGRPSAGGSGDDRNDSDGEDKAELSTTFARFEDVLCELLSVASVIGDVQGVLGEHRGNFVLALNRMVDAGDIPWVCEVDSGVDGSGNEMEIEGAGAGAASSSQMDTDEEVVPTSAPGVEEGEIVSTNQMEIDGVEIVSTGQIQKRVEDKRVVPDRGKVTLEQFAAVPIPVAKVQGNWPPPLPLIQNEALRRQALTPETVRNFRNPAGHYQRLEWLGDAYMEVLVSRILFDRFPTVREGPLTRMRPPLLTNRLFSNFAAIYNFETMITGYKAEDAQPKGACSLKILADCFEAYVGAVALSDPDKGFDTLMQWLSALYEPLFKDVGSGDQFNDGYPYGKLGFLVPSRPLRRRGEFRKRTNPPVVGAKEPKKALRRSKRLSALDSQTRHRQSQPPPDNRSGRRLIQYETGSPITIKDSDSEAEDEADWEEVEIVDKEVEIADKEVEISDKENQNPAGIPIDLTARRKLDTLVAGDDVSVEYVCVDKPGPSGRIDAMQGVGSDQDEWKVTIKLTGWGFVNQSIGSGWGANEREAGLRAAMNIVRDKAFCRKLALRKYRESRLVSARPRKASAVPAPSVISTSWKEIDGVVVINDD